MRAAPARKPRETTTSSGFHLRARSAPLFPRLRLAASMAPPLSRSLGASSSAAALHFPCAPSPFSAAATAATATTVAFLRLGSSVSSRRGFRCEASAPGWGASGGECPVQRASFTSTASYLLDSIAQRLCSCRGVFAHDISRRYCSLKEGHNMSVHNSLKGLHFSADISNSSGSQGSDKNDMESVKDKLLVDCGPDQECVTGGIVALGKFDALHLGHRELAIQASKAGTPFLLSFVGMAEVLGWEYRAPIVAKCDRKRVLSSWAPLCGDVVPLEFHVEFSKVRQLSPRQFVERLSKDLRISGVVAGENYRFGYRASGDASELVRLCEEYGLEAHILSSVLDSKGSAAGKKELVSSTRVRQALAVGDVNYVAELLGRRHRLVLRAPEDLDSAAEGGKLSIPRSCLLNQHPKEGLYESCSLLADDRLVGPCSVVISTSHVHVEPHDGPGQLLPKRDYSHVGIDLGG